MSTLNLCSRALAFQSRVSIGLHWFCSSIESDSDDTGYTTCWIIPVPVATEERLSPKKCTQHAPTALGLGHP